jgi:hypothetical protein
MEMDICTRLATSSEVPENPTASLSLRALSWLLLTWTIHLSLFDNLATCSQWKICGF